MYSTMYNNITLKGPHISKFKVKQKTQNVKLIFIKVLV